MEIRKRIGERVRRVRRREESLDRSCEFNSGGLVFVPHLLLPLISTFG